MTSNTLTGTLWKHNLTSPRFYTTTR
jgi:hypothetical protein